VRPVPAAFSVKSISFPFQMINRADPYFFILSEENLPLKTAVHPDDDGSPKRMAGLQ